MDKYDKAIAYLTENPGKMEAVWCEQNYGDESEMAQAHCLFEYLCPNDEDTWAYGCITQVASGSKRAFTDELTQLVLDADLPTDIDNVTLQHLPKCAEIQRIADIVCNRT